MTRLEREVRKIWRGKSLAIADQRFVEMKKRQAGLLAGLASMADEGEPCLKAFQAGLHAVGSKLDAQEAYSFLWANSFMHFKALKDW